jgi:hypothetical protein
VTKVLATIALGAASLGIVAQPAAAQSPSDREIAKAGVFQADDFPAGWRATPHKKSEERIDVNDCPVVKKAGGTHKQQTANVDGREFQRSRHEYFSAAALYRTEERPRRVYQAVASKDLHQCYTRLFEDAFKSEFDADDAKAELGERTGSRSYGDESTDFEIKLTATKSNVDQKLFVDVAFVRVGRALGAYYYATEDEPSSDACNEFSSDDCVNFDGLITSATDRLTAATGGQTTTATTQPR